MSKLECDGKDIMHVGPQIAADGSRLCVRHLADHTRQEGIVKPVKEGEPLNTELPLVLLERREDGAYDVNEVWGGKEEAESSGPAMVNSEKFKTGWDRIFGKQTVGVA